MADLAPVPWPPAPITTGRLVLRESGAGDRPAYLELFSSAEVHAYLGGAQPRAELDRAMPAVPGQRPGTFVIDRDGVMIGTVTLSRRDHPPADGQVEIGYLLLPSAWGHGYAAEACAALLHWYARTAPAGQVMLCTQVASERSMRLAARLGFTEVSRYRAWDADQWLGVWSPGALSG